jgi:iron complex outermembrane receptor protein
MTPVHTSRARLTATSCLTSAAIALASAAIAQPAPEPPAAPAASVEEVVVTAQKRTESLVNVPIAIVAVSGAKLARSGVNDMSDLAAVVPGLHVDDAGAFFQPSIRGVGTAIAGAGASANVATYVDGIYKPEALSNDFNFIDIDSIQVLKGPQGTLFGRNSAGGAIVVTTRTPSFTPEFEMRAGYGSFGTVNGALFASTGLTDKLAVSLALGGQHSDGWIKNIATGRQADKSDDFAGRGKILYKPTDGVKFTLVLDAYRTNDPGAYMVSSYKGWSDAAFFNVPLSIGNSREVSLSGPVAHIAEGGDVALKSEFDFGWATLTSYSAAQWTSGTEATNELASTFPINGTPPSNPGVQVIVDNADWRYHESTYTQEFDLAHTGKGPFDWVTGLFYYYDKTIYSPFNLGFYGPFGPGGIFSGTYPYPPSSYINTGDTPLSSFGQPNYSGAVFADGTYNLGKWHLTVGGRYSIDRAGERFTSYPGIGSGGIGGYFSANHTFYAFTPRAILRYSLTDDSNVYVSFSEGTKAGLYNSSGFLSQRTYLQPERIKDYEGGYKVAGHGWRLEASGFYYDYSNLQVTTYTGGTAFQQNAKAAEIYGADLNFEAHLFDHLVFNAGGAYTHARYTDFPNAALQIFCSNYCATPGTGVPAIGVVNGTANVDGGVMERTPTWTGNVGLDYTTGLFSGVLSLNGNVSYQSQSSFDFANTLKDSAHALLNLRADWTDPSKHFTLSVIGRNVTDTTYLVQVLPNAGGFGAVYGEPANVMFQIAYKY